MQNPISVLRFRIPFGIRIHVHINLLQDGTLLRSHCHCIQPVNLRHLYCKHSQYFNTVGIGTLVFHTVIVFTAQHLLRPCPLCHHVCLSDTHYVDIAGVHFISEQKPQRRSHDADRRNDHTHYQNNGRTNQHDFSLCYAGNLTNSRSGCLKNPFFCCAGCCTLYSFRQFFHLFTL